LKDLLKETGEKSKIKRGTHPHLKGQRLEEKGKEDSERNF